MTDTQPAPPDVTTMPRSTRAALALARHPWRALGGLLAFLVLAGVLGGPVAGALESGGGFVTADADSARAVERVEAATGQAPSPDIALLVDLPGDGAGSVAEVGDRLAAVDGIAEVVSVTPDGQPAVVAEDGGSALVLGTLSAGAEDDVVAEDVLAAFEGDDGVTVGGGAVAFSQIGGTVSEDLGRAEMLALPILVLLSLLFFRGRAALMPLVVGATTVLGTFLVLMVVNQFFSLSIFALNLVIGLGLGLAIDYTLFLLTRYREEVARQGATPAAIATTMRTAGRTVAFSAATVAAALATLLVFPLSFIRSMGTAGAVVAVVAALASLVIAPIAFGLWGERLARRQARSATAEAPQDGGRWYRLSHAVMRRPGLIAAGTAAVMLLLAAPALGTHWTPVDGSVVPEGQSARTVTDAIEADFPSAASTPVTAVIETEGDGAAAVASYADQAAGLDGVTGVAPPVELAPGTWQVDVAVPGDPAGETAQDVVAELRDLDVGGVDALVTGPAAQFVDQQAAIAGQLPVALALLVGLTMVLLWLMTGSVVLPVKAVVMNALTVASALGAITFVYQGGRLTGLLGYTPNGGVEPTDFLITATLVFALSTDYGVFLLGRVKEARDSGLGEREAVAVGLQRTGAVVTAAAILLAVAIGAFSTSSISFIQQIGVATAFGVLVDAFVVRSLLVPSLMGLLGKWNWWAPMPLRRLHDRIGLSEEVAVPATASRETAPVGTPAS